MEGREYNKSIEIAQAHKKICEAQSVAIIAHKNPDGDAFGITLALHEYIQSLGKLSRPVSIGPFCEKFSYLRDFDTFTQDFEPDNFDLIICCDSGAPVMSGYHKAYPELFENSSKVINIDHHESNEYFGGINIVDTSAPSATCIMFEVFEKWNANITKTMATALLTGIMTDTGSFMHANTTPKSYRIAGKLLEKGADIDIIRKSIFKNTRIEALKLWGTVFEKAALNKDGVLVSAVTQKDFRQLNAVYEDLTGVVDYLNSVPQAKYAMLLSEKGHLVKGSLRTQTNIDLDKVASTFGGGGHKKAAGFAIEGRLEPDVTWKIVQD